MQHLRMPQEVARGAYRSFVKPLGRIPHVRTDSVQAGLDLLRKQQVKQQLTPEKYIDNSSIRELEPRTLLRVSSE